MIDYIHTEEIHNTKAARAFLPFLYEYLKPTSAIDIGCGLGTWLQVLKENGTSEILGVDGDHVDKSKLKIFQNEFLAHDLCVPLILNKKYDLSICLEVAEHLPEEKAEIIIDTLTNSADTILFSAALPFQGGQNHINEQPFAYWVTKFNKRGFIVKDVFRQKIWDNPEIEWWYKQNMFLIVKSNEKQDIIADYYHPERYLQIIHERSRLNRQYFNIIQGKIQALTALKILIKSLIRW
ncbi:hypothetical protein Pedsa_2316 [Pseudopedobacter saltans DSM 12145]|uniref:Methyltransferase type 11 n=1 Tax=Pseudopedobacter saltans (strain ATCC 51119 / DSM 12145 / JCM 21818 / CCUG 39354 / LMG 10337 / NBRC 100064 / NCIMB 13643) TaxID=762903 RepID=F0SD78_PSESL|nr:methyltransferase domain-containing protein [Pseudopedobacter saltans]ADY52864.1 hypothetical protein Pedsa_2316 [Pseudopedobacter saltans DSM 12145]